MRRDGRCLNPEVCPIIQRCMLCNHRYPTCSQRRFDLGTDGHRTVLRQRPCKPMLHTGFESVVVGLRFRRIEAINLAVSQFAGAGGASGSPGFGAVRQGGLSWAPKETGPGHCWHIIRSDCLSAWQVPDAVLREQWPEMQADSGPSVLDSCTPGLRSAVLKLPVTLVRRWAQHKATWQAKPCSQSPASQNGQLVWPLWALSVADSPPIRTPVGVEDAHVSASCHSCLEPTQSTPSALHVSITSSKAHRRGEDSR